MYCILYRQSNMAKILVHVQYEFVRQHFLTMNHSDDPQTLSLIFLQCRLTQLKGSASRQCFASGFFHVSVSPQPQSILLGSFQIFSKIRRDICKSRFTKMQIFPPVLLVLLISAAKLPLVSTTPVANCLRYQRHRQQICHRCKQHWWQTMGTIIKLLTT